MICKDERDGCRKTEKILRMAHGNSKPKSCIIDDQQLRSLHRKEMIKFNDYPEKE